MRRVFNGAIDRRPRLIARCQDANDVRAAIALARDAELPLAVHGGGHSVAGHSVCDGGVLLFPRERAGEVLRAYCDFMRDAPDEVGGGFALLCAPPEPFVPEPLRLQPVCGVILTYAGDLEQGAAVLAPMRALGGLDLIQPMPYVALQRLLDPASPKGMQNHWTADFLAGLPDEAIDTLVAGVAPSPLTQIIVVPGGGALSRVPDDATAMGHRRAPWNVHYLSMWPDPADSERNVSWVRALAAAMKPWTTGGLYLNFIGEEGEARVRAAFGPEKYARLVALKDRWDPENLFRLNHNIKPSRPLPAPSPAARTAVSA